MARKSSNDKLTDSRDMPKVVDLSGQPDVARRFGGPKMLIAAPLQYNAIMAKVPQGMLITSDRLREHLARESGADFTCPLTAGIFINICAQAAAERQDGGFPYWRTLRAGGELNEKYPGGVAEQQKRLEAEGHTVLQRGKRRFVKDYDRSLWTID